MAGPRTGEAASTATLPVLKRATAGLAVPGLDLAGSGTTHRAAKASERRGQSAASGLNLILRGEHLVEPLTRRRKTPTHTAGGSSRARTDKARTSFVRSSTFLRVPSNKAEVAAANDYILLFAKPPARQAVSTIIGPRRQGVLQPRSRHHGVARHRSPPAGSVGDLWKLLAVAVRTARPGQPSLLKWLGETRAPTPACKSGKLNSKRVFREGILGGHGVPHTKAPSTGRNKASRRQYPVVLRSWL